MHTCVSTFISIYWKVLETMTNPGTMNTPRADCGLEILFQETRLLVLEELAGSVYGTGSAQNKPVPSCHSRQQGGCQRLRGHVKKMQSQLGGLLGVQRWNNLNSSNDNNYHGLQHIKYIWIKFLLIYIYVLIFIRGYVFINFRERGRGREREKETSMWERNIDWLPPGCAPAGDGTRQGSNPQSFAERDGAANNQAIWPGHNAIFKNVKIIDYL